MTIDNIITQITKEGAKKPLEHPIRSTLKCLVLLAVYSVVLIAFSGLRPDIAFKFSQPIFIIEFIVMLAVMIAAAYGASLLSLPDSAQKPWAKYLPFAFLALLLGMLFYQIITTHTLPLAECLKLGNYNCMIHVMTNALLPAVLMFMVMRKAAPTQCCWAGSMVGLCVAGFGYMIMRVIEVSDDPTSLLIWHFIPVFAIVIIGVIVAKKLFSKIWQR